MKYKSNQKTISKMAINTYISIITLNVNGLSALIKWHKLDQCIKNFFKLKKINKRGPK